MSDNSFDFKEQWGKSAHIDLTGCEHDRLTSAPILEAFVKGLVEKIGMMAHGPCYIDRFGSPDSDLEGYSAMQFIETSAITVHLDEVGNRAYIDVFSCKDFVEQEAFDFAKQYFGAQNGKLTTLKR
ncbi:MAG: hypothetical protein A3D99_03375 [Candidatus Andersenbacteria bacterium RIFCSPHIGHO2_12_FULL_45_11]|uniref:S-adenosylmethionine decarboxylase n=1 Tax=Candidatus Andersenbacteria bacterium RIFCSPHIGHO2_12_FULL_45_11 TaxID=1797281 RepID=A0A1G1X3C6_9BACT|nr:MAG: hypothetical protein A3D99_03375 [Candidatus Andersenbacteria bacterium RIFCSPHIGHO2_12_FULL_45_11]